MNREEFEAFLENVRKRVEREHEQERPGPGEAFDKGYAMGKLLAELQLRMDDGEKQQFSDGVSMGMDIGTVQVLH